MDNPLLLLLIKCGCAAFCIDLAALEQRVYDYENLVRHCDDRFLLAAPRYQTAVERRQEGIGLFHRRPGRLHQRRAQIAIAITEARALALASALVLPRCQPSPTAHVRA